MAKKTYMGVCPKCEDDNIEYYDHEFIGESLKHDCHCMSCGLYFHEYEALIYDGYSYKDENGVEHEFTVDGDEI